MKTLFNTTDNAAIIARINLLNPESKALWGKMDVAQMIAHCEVPIRAAFGEITLSKTFIGILFGRYFKKKLVTQNNPFSKNLPTDKHFLIHDTRIFDAEKTKLIKQISRFLETGQSGITKNPHPFFGKLTPDEWAALQWKHLDHHLRQFGV
jgi:hypothetical protein